MTYSEILEKYTLKIGQSVMAGEVVRDIRSLEPLKTIELSGRITAENRDGKDYCEVVRCKDCKHSYGDFFCNIFHTMMPYSFYCKCGERKNR